MIVITLSKVPAALRGDLTKWCQEIQTGVYVGNFSARIRDLLWSRIQKNIGLGEATIVYTTNNELGYKFKTTRSDKKIVDFDGIPLIMHLDSAPKLTVKHGFSKAAKLRFAERSRRKIKLTKAMPQKRQIVAIDLETTGLDPIKDKIISIGAAYFDVKGNIKKFYKLVKTTTQIPSKISELTKLNNEVLNCKGIPLKDALSELLDFIGDKEVIGYNLEFDLTFLSVALRNCNISNITNATKDLMSIVKTKDLFLDNYRLETVLTKYKIQNDQPHNALCDAIATLKLADKLIKIIVL